MMASEDFINYTDALILIGVLALAFLIHVRLRKKAVVPYPPGPKRLPILGNLLQMPSGGFEWKVYDRMCKELGTDIMYLRAAGSDIILLNSLEAVTDLFDKRSLIYSNRPRFPMAVDLMGWGWMFSMVDYGSFWRDRRRIFTKYFQTDDPSVYRTNHRNFVRGMLPELLESPNDFVEVARNAIGGSSLSLAYGLSIKKKDDPYIKVAETALASYNEAVIPSNFLVNVIPTLQYIPSFFSGAEFKKKAKHWTRFQEDLRNLPFEQTLLDMADGSAKPSFSRTYLEKITNLEGGEKDRQEEIIKDAAGVAFVGSVDTTLAAIHTFYAAMLLFPEAQKKAQKELDRVLAGRLPEYWDEKDLPYVTALIKETLRWNPFVPLGLPHSSREDDIYRGYYIPKGAVLIPNTWSMLQDEKYYSDPTAFRPERFLKDGQLNPDIRDPTHIIFGFGRRICPGSQVAWSFLWLTVATILSTLDISKEIDAAGDAIEPDIKFHSSIVCEPAPFKCTIKPRSKEAESLIRHIDLSE